MTSFGSDAAVEAPDVTLWFKKQLPYAYQRILDNIHPNKTLPGTVIASVTRQNPPYYYHWVRDSALVLNSMVNLYKVIPGPAALKYENIMWDYASLSRKHQQQPGCNPIQQDKCEALGGPAEPKYEVGDGTVFKGGWGRLQNDGPALRASVLIRFAYAYLEKGGSKEKVRNLLYDSKLPTASTIKVDLEYTANHWRDLTVDLWEEIHASHFFTRMVIRRALIEGSEFAAFMGDSGASKYYKQQADLLSSQLDYHWDSYAGYIREMISTPQWHQRTGRNVATVLAVTHGYNDDGFYSPVNERILASVHRLLLDFNEIYDVNTVHKDKNSLVLGPAVGRFREDTYDGSLKPNSVGHPWYMTTMAVAELYYRIIDEYQKAKTITVTPISLPWFKFLGIDIRVGSFRPPSNEYSLIISKVAEAAEALVRRVEFHLNGEKSMAEQYSRFNGSPLSAQHLTWSYASVVSAFEARKKAFNH